MHSIVSHKKKGNRSSEAGSVARKGLCTKVWSVNSMAKPSYSLALRGDNAPFNFVGTVDQGVVLTTSAGGEVDGATNFNLAELGNASTLASLFDQYRIRMVEIWLTPTYQNYIGGNSASRFAIAVDYDNSSSGTFSALQQYENCIDIPATNGVYLRFTPHLPIATVSSGAVNSVNEWLDCATTSTPHYGVKYAAPATAVTYTLNQVKRYWVQFRNIQ